jgi:hypothetical protein
MSALPSDWKEHALARRTFIEAGYILARDVIPLPVVDETRQYLQEAAATSIALAKKLLGATEEEALNEAILRANDDGLLASLPKQTLDLLSGHLPTQTRLSERLWAIARAPRLRELLYAVLGTRELCMHMPPMARFVPPGHSTAAVPAHQDIAYNRHMSDFVTCWVPLVEIDDACGGVTIYEGSNEPVELKSHPGNIFWAGGLDVEKYDARNIYMKPGDVLVFNKWLVHCSMPNLSERIRYSMDLRFFGKQDHSSKHFLDMQRWIVIAPTDGDANV